MLADELQQAECEIDTAFANNGLKAVPFTQSAWTVLSVAEDMHFKNMVVEPLPEREAAIYVDGLMNGLTYPLRVLHQQAPKDPTLLNPRYIEEHYALALQWLDAAEDYTHFCSIFPLFHAKEIDLTIVGDWLEPTDWSSTNLAYEVYDRFVAKRDPKSERRLDANAVAATLRTCIRSSGGAYSINFTRRLLDELARHLGPFFEGRHVLPENWQFSRFSLAQYRSVFVCLQIMAAAWFAARQIVAGEGVQGIAYESSLWTPRKGALTKLLTRQTGLPGQIIEEILRYLTFGEVGVRNPDIAIQPLVDLCNDHYAVSPFVMTHVNAERNLCVLLNQVPADRRLYAQLVDEKEEQIRTETIDSLRPLGFDFKHGQLDQTDIDLAIIDRTLKVCLCIELKWFIEPAEIREVLMRSEELEKGVSQAKQLNRLFAAGDSRLLTLLGIDGTYDLLSMVGSVNFIGRPGIRDPEIPIAKLWHVVADIEETQDLSSTLQWLRARRYLPVKDRDYKIRDVPLECGRWKSRWYGITYA
jgi:hypothetical protein